MKLEPPVPVPVDSILSWGCDDDLIDSKFGSCDVADSTTGGLDSSSGVLAGSSGLVSLGGGLVKNSSLLSLDGLDGLFIPGTGNNHMTTPATPSPCPAAGPNLAELKPMAPFEFSGLTHLESSSGGNQQHQQQGGTRAVLDINLNLYKTNSANGIYYSEPVSTTVVNGLVSLVPGAEGGEAVKPDSMTDYLMNTEIEDIAAILGSAIADSTVASAAAVANVPDSLDGSADVRDQWADIDAWFESACATVYKHEPMLESPASSVTSASSNSSTLPSLNNSFTHPALTGLNNLQSQHQQPPPPPQTTLNKSCSIGSTLQALLTQGSSGTTSIGMGFGHHQDQNMSLNNNNQCAVKSEPSMDMPLLQRRLTAGRDPVSSMAGPPPTQYHSCSVAAAASKELQQQLPHTTFHSGPSLNHVSTSLPHLGNDGCHSSGGYPTARRSIGRSGGSSLDKDFGDLHDSHDMIGGSGSTKSKQKNRSPKAKMTTVMTTEGGKEKPVHRCNICNRGFLNKSNIKVHLRTHTGEKPFKCDACSKAFRQKAHLLKHMHIHKRVGRD